METFPQYRKLADKHFYHLVSNTEWSEIQRLGSKYFLNHFQAINFLDRLFLADLLSTDQGRYEVITKQEFDSIESLSFVR